MPFTQLSDPRDRVGRYGEFMSRFSPRQAPLHMNVVLSKEKYGNVANQRPADTCADMCFDAITKGRPNLVDLSNQSPLKMSGRMRVHVARCALSAQTGHT